MTEEFESELKEWVKNNLLLEVEETGGDNDVYVILRFVGDKHEFCRERISIPEKS